jgi:hypothetical protein
VIREEDFKSVSRPGGLQDGGPCRNTEKNQIRYLNKSLLMPPSDFFQFGNKKETYKKLYLSVVLYGSEMWTIGKNEEGILNAFETWCWRRMLKIKWTVKDKMDS